jgi:hypothetical protein
MQGFCLRNCVPIQTNCIDRQADTEAGRQGGRQTGKQTDRQEDIKTDMTSPSLKKKSPLGLVPAIRENHPWDWSQA